AHALDEDLPEVARTGLRRQRTGERGQLDERDLHATTTHIPGASSAFSFRHDGLLYDRNAELSEPAVLSVRTGSVLDHFAAGPIAAGLDPGSGGADTPSRLSARVGDRRLRSLLHRENTPVSRPGVPRGALAGSRGPETSRKFLTRGSEAVKTSLGDALRQRGAPTPRTSRNRCRAERFPSGEQWECRRESPVPLARCFWPAASPPARSPGSAWICPSKATFLLGRARRTARHTPGRSRQLSDARATP